MCVANVTTIVKCAIRSCSMHVYSGKTNHKKVEREGLRKSKHYDTAAGTTNHIYHHAVCMQCLVFAEQIKVR